MEELKNLIRFAKKCGWKSVTVIDRDGNLIAVEGDEDLPPAPAPEPQKVFVPPTPTAPRSHLEQTQNALLREQARFREAKAKQQNDGLTVIDNKIRDLKNLLKNF